MAAAWCALPLRVQQAFEKVAEIFPHEVTELTRIEINAVMLGTHIVMDVRLVGIRLHDHGLTTPRTRDAVHFVVLLAHLHRAGVDRIRALDLLEIAMLRSVEPDSLTGLATVHGHTGKFDGFHRGMALGTAQGHGRLRKR